MFSFVIPTYNESSTIENTLNKLLAVISGDDEIIVVDGCSEDGTAGKVKGLANVKLVENCQRGRARQMNTGAEHATREYIFFLHADTTIDLIGIEKLKNEVKNNSLNWGWFYLKLNSTKYIYRILEILASYRTKIANEPLGDHGIFVKRELFNRIGGYPEIPIMEDVELVKKLKKVSHGKRINHHVLTSVRRFERCGILKTTFNISMMRVAYFLGKSPETLSKWYLNHR
jgi:rSAM/selenodomain-associated transferase 2